MRCIMLALLFSTLTLIGCSKATKHPQDPFENYNRVVFGFNKTADKVILKPVSYIYLKYLPQPLQLGIGNFFDNLREIPNVANDLLQGKFAYATHDTTRFLINTTIGVFGFFDPAASLGLEHRKEDFGQTLYTWGYKNSAYLVLPFLGPSSVRDTIGLGVDYFALSIWPWIDSDWKFILLGIDYVDLRARLLRKEVVLDVLAVDEYVFMRDAYFQHREYLFNEKIESNNTVDPYGSNTGNSAP